MAAIIYLILMCKPYNVDVASVCYAGLKAEEIPATSHFTRYCMQLAIA